MNAVLAGFSLNYEICQGFTSPIAMVNVLCGA